MCGTIKCATENDRFACCVRRTARWFKLLAGGLGESYVDHLARFNGVQSLEKLWHVGEQIGNSTGSGANQNQCDCAATETLFVFNATVQSDEHFKSSCFRERQQFSILLASEANLWDCPTFMLGEIFLDLSRDTLVEQHLHRS